MVDDATTVIRTESDRLAAVLAATDPHRDVPTCPDWTATDLLWHLTEVHESWAAILAQEITTDEQAERIAMDIAPRPDDPDELQRRRAAATDALVSQLEQRRDDEPAWFWFSPLRSVGTIRRMQTHEATIHRVDAELAAGEPVTHIGPKTATSGLNHVLTVMWPAAFEWIPDWAETTLVATVDIEPDGGPSHRLGISRWSGTGPKDGSTFDVPVARLLGPDTAAEQLPRATVTGSALALNLWAWGRGLALDHLADGPLEIAITGDDEAEKVVRALIDEGIT